jgi:hypothetical protein
MVSAIFDPTRWREVPGFDFDDITYHRSVERLARLRRCLEILRNEHEAVLALQMLNPPGAIAAAAPSDPDAVQLRRAGNQDSRPTKWDPPFDTRLRDIADFALETRIL